MSARKPEDLEHVLLVARDARLENRREVEHVLVVEAVDAAPTVDEMNRIGAQYREMLVQVGVKPTRSDRRFVAIAKLERRLREERK